MSIIDFFNSTPLDELKAYTYMFAFGSYVLSVLAAHSFGYGSTSRKKMYDLPVILKFIMFFSFNEKKINLWAIVMWSFSVIAILCIFLVEFFNINYRVISSFIIISFFVILISMCIDFVFFDNKDN